MNVTAMRIASKIGLLEEPKLTEEIRKHCGGNEQLERDVRRYLEKATNLEPASAPVDVATMLLPTIPTRLDRFWVGKKLGGGGFGVVYLAIDSGTNHEVAIKVLREELRGCETARLQFLREARCMQRLKHPHIVKVLEVVEDGPVPYFVMPRFPATVASLLKNAGGPLDEGVALRIAQELADALHYTHECEGVYHRDIKPANLLVNSDGRSAVGDFGLGRTDRNDSLVAAEREVIQGTPAYMPPGVAWGKKEVASWDIYSFGATFYEVLTGHPPYSGSPAEVLNQLREGPPVPILARNPQAPRALAAVAAWAMERELRDRYAAMAYVVEDLERIARGVEPLGPRGKVRVRWRLVAASLAVAMLTMGLVATSRWPAGGAIIRDNHNPQQEFAAPTTNSEIQPRNIFGSALRNDFPFSFTLEGTEEKGDIHYIPRDHLLSFSMETATTCYIAIFSRDDQGSVTRLFPNDFDPDHHIIAGKRRLIPGERAYVFPLTAGGGPDQLQVIACTERWEAPMGEAAGGFGRFRNPEELKDLEEAVRGIGVGPKTTRKVSEKLFKVQVLAR